MATTGLDLKRGPDDDVEEPLESSANDEEAPKGAVEVVVFENEEQAARPKLIIQERFPFSYRTIFIGWGLFLPQYFIWTLIAGTSDWTPLVAIACAVVVGCYAAGIAARQTLCPPKPDHEKVQRVHEARRRSIVKGTGKRLSVGAVAFNALMNPKGKKKQELELLKQQNEALAGSDSEEEGLLGAHGDAEATGEEKAADDSSSDESENLQKLLAMSQTATSGKGKKGKKGNKGKKDRRPRAGTAGSDADSLMSGESEVDDATNPEARLDPLQELLIHREKVKKRERRKHCLRRMILDVLPFTFIFFMFSLLNVGAIAGIIHICGSDESLFVRCLLATMGTMSIGSALVVTLAFLFLRFPIAYSEYPSLKAGVLIVKSAVFGIGLLAGWITIPAFFVGCIVGFFALTVDYADAAGGVAFLVPLFFVICICGCPAAFYLYCCTGHAKKALDEWGDEEEELDNPIEWSPDPCNRSCRSCPMFCKRRAARCFRWYRMRKPHKMHLSVALRYGFEEGVRAALDNGEDPNAIVHGFSPVEHALKGGNPSCIRILADAGANLSFPKKGVGADGRMPVRDLAPLHSAAAENNIQMTIALVECGEDVNVRTRGARSTPLHVAIAAGSTEVVEFLLSHPDADVVARDAENRTPADIAETVRLEHPVLAQMVLDALGAPSQALHQVIWAHGLKQVDEAEKAENEAKVAARRKSIMARRKSLMGQSARAIEGDEADEVKVTVGPKGTLTTNLRKPREDSSEDSDSNEEMLRRARAAIHDVAEAAREEVQKSALEDVRSILAMGPAGAEAVDQNRKRRSIAGATSSLAKAAAIFGKK